MTADAGQRLLQTGQRVLRVAHRLHVLPLRGDLPAAFCALAADPAARLEDLLEPLLPVPEPLGQGQYEPRDPWPAADTAPERPHAAGSPGVAERGDRGRGLRALPATWLPDHPAALAAHQGGPGERWESTSPTDSAPRPATTGASGAWPRPAAARPPDHPAALVAHAGGPGEGGEPAGLVDSAPQRSAIAGESDVRPGLAATRPSRSDYLTAQLAELPALAGIYRVMAALGLPPQPTHPGVTEWSPRHDVAGAQAAPPGEQRDRSSVRRDRSGPTRRQPGPATPGWSEPGAPYSAGPADAADGSGPATARRGAVRPVAPDNATGTTSARSGAPGGIDPDASVGLRLAQGAAGLAALLGANLDAGDEPEPPLAPPEGTLDEGPGLPVAPPAAPPAHRAAQGPSGGEEEPSAGHDLEQLIDELADRLEFELARTYGTSGG